MDKVTVGKSQGMSSACSANGCWMSTGALMLMLRCGFVKSMWGFVDVMRRFSGRGIVLGAAGEAVGSVERSGKR
jgi:hypothetical protein